ncbi:MAG: hypothetical protein IJS73_00860 [Paludibacteraceae bacterium]|nr:hypothetical protein [Paludibacteraceae bacterium]
MRIYLRQNEGCASSCTARRCVATCFRILFFIIEILTFVRMRLFVRMRIYLRQNEAYVSE